MNRGFLGRVLVILLLAGGFSACAHTPLTGSTGGNEDGEPEPLSDTDELVAGVPDSDAEMPEVVSPIEEIPLVYNQHVTKFIDYFQGPGRRSFEGWLSRSGAYIPLMEAILDDEGLPRNLVYLALIESGFSAMATSRAKAVGYWQFMEGTGRRYGLRIDDWVDERRDPELATRAAARYLKDLYSMFGDWHLAAAGYNAGENKIARAMRRYGTENFWEMIKHRGYIRTETMQYVPKLIAAITIAEDPEAFGFTPTYATPLDLVTVEVPGDLDLGKVAYAAGLSVPAFRLINPSLRRWQTPPDVADYPVQIPRLAAFTFAARLTDAPAGVSPQFVRIPLLKNDTIETVADRYQVRVADLQFLNPRARWAPREEIFLPFDPDGFRYADKPAQPHTVMYRVRRGDSLIGIARRFHTKATDIRKANGLRSTRIRYGQTLQVPLPTGARPVMAPKSYRVRAGDTLSGIAQRYRVSADALARYNGLKGGRVMAGQLISIP